MLQVVDGTAEIQRLVIARDLDRLGGLAREVGRVDVLQELPELVDHLARVLGLLPELDRESSMTWSATKIGASVRTASASASEGRESTSISLPSTASVITAWKVFSRSWVTATLDTVAFSSLSIEVTRSCVIGRAVGVFWSFMRIAAASGWPIQMGRNLLPPRVLRKDDRLLSDHVERDAVDRHLLHRRTSSGDCTNEGFGHLGGNQTVLAAARTARMSSIRVRWPSTQSRATVSPRSAVVEIIPRPDRSTARTSFDRRYAPGRTEGAPSPATAR